MADQLPHERLFERLRQHGQAHLLRFWAELSEPEREQLAAEIETLDLGAVSALWSGECSNVDWAALAARATSPPAIRLSEPNDSFRRRAARAAGQQLLADGKVAALLVAGGQGTRMGFPRPKGMFPIGPVSGATLFQILFEKLLAVSRRYGHAIPLYLMTSPATDSESRDFLQSHDNFGLDADQLHIFCQGTMPALDARSGQILLAEKHRLALSPDGHGGRLKALAASGGLDDLASRGVETIFYFQVDNPLTQVCDAEFLGHHRLAEAELSTQVVAKRSPEDRVGNVVSIDGRVRVIEYSDMPLEAAARRDEQGELICWAGSIAVHAIEVDLLRRMARHADALPFHRAIKKTPFVDSLGNRVEPREPNALKFERFIFDLMEHAARGMVFEVDPGCGFAPAKNAPGASADTAAHTQQAMIELHARWLRAAGATVGEQTPVEISPLFALDVDDCLRRIVPGTSICEPTYLR